MKFGRVGKMDGNGLLEPTRQTGDNLARDIDTNIVEARTGHYSFAPLAFV
jgi:hypothetical protein